MALLPWAERVFDFPNPVEWYPDAIERFRGLPARADECVRSVPAAWHARTDGKGWSIQENIAHLLTLETLFNGRIDDFLAGLPVLRPADMNSIATRQAAHAARPVDEILPQLRAARDHQVQRLSALEPADFSRVSVHPRLQRPMRLVDAVTFVCCHDDYHLARIADLRRTFSAG